MRLSFWPDAEQPWSELLSLAQHIETTGWDGFWIADHFMPNEADVSAPCHEVWTLLSAIAACVPRVRIGPMVACNTYRHPAVLAKMAASLDHVSDGRLVLGLGSGWQENEHKAYGLEFDTVPGRLRRLEEACQILKSLFTQPRTNFDGRYYCLRDAPLEPKPIQQPLPLLIGGGGEKVTLKITAKYADAWHVWGDVATFAHKSGVLDRHCDNLGRAREAISRSSCALLVLSEDEPTLRRERSRSHDYPTIVANRSELIDKLNEYKQAGCEEFIMPDFNMPAGNAKRDLLDELIEEVAPQVR